MENKSKFMAFLLRHHPDALGGLNKNGQAPIGKLAEVLEITEDEIRSIIASDSKSRYREENGLVWAVQGHSIKGIEIPMDKSDDTVAYHGTKKKFLPSIEEQGLLPMSRVMVHLSPSIKLANSVASRRAGENVLLQIDLVALRKSGIEVYKADNGVLLASSVPFQFITVVNS